MNVHEHAGPWGESFFSLTVPLQSRPLRWLTAHANCREGSLWLCRRTLLREHDIKVILGGRRSDSEALSVVTRKVCLISDVLETYYAVPFGSQVFRDPWLHLLSFGLLLCGHFAVLNARCGQRSACRRGKHHLSFKKLSAAVKRAFLLRPCLQ